MTWKLGVDAYRPFDFRCYSFNKTRRSHKVKKINIFYFFQRKWITPTKTIEKRNNNVIAEGTPEQKHQHNYTRFCFTKIKRHVPLLVAALLVSYPTAFYSHNGYSGSRSSTAFKCSRMGPTSAQKYQKRWCTFYEFKWNLTKVVLSSSYYAKLSSDWILPTTNTTRRVRCGTSIMPTII